jgi:hypothetical protein
MNIDNKDDYSTAWIDLQVEVRMMHSFFLQGRWGDAKNCAIKSREICERLVNLCDEMDSIPE